MAPALARLTRLAAALVAVALCAAALSAAAASAGEVRRAPLPDWALDRPLPVAGAAGGGFVEQGIEILLRDTQIRLEEAGHVRLTREVRAVSDRIGLERAGRIEIEYDPAIEELTLHRVEIRRGAARIDRGDVETVALRREAELDRGILDGRLTLHGAVPGLRVGDAVDVVWSVRVRPSIFADRFHDRFADRAFEPVRAEHRRILVPPGRSLSARSRGGRLPEATMRDGWTDYAWSRENAMPAWPDRSYPYWTGFWGLTETGEFRDWTEIARGLAPYYASDDALPAELQLFVAATLAAGGDADDRATAAFRLVQDRIRYVGIEIGAGGYIPRPPAKVWDRGYGDCKDKALLLVALLDALGIAADVTLVHSDLGPGLPQALPSPYAFDHAIVRVRSDRGDYFLDPTQVLQGGRARDVATGAFHWGLPLAADTAGLVGIPRPSLTAPVEDIEDRIDFAGADEGDAARFTVTTRFRGAEADRMRVQLRTTPLSVWEEDYLDYYDTRFPGLRATQPIEVADDFDANVLTMTERYAIPEAAFDELDLWSAFTLSPDGVRNKIWAGPSGTEAAYPVAVERMGLRHAVTLTGLPQPLNPPPDVLIADGPVAFSRTGSRDAAGTELTVDWRLTVDADHLLPRDEAAWRRAVEQIGEEDDWQYNLFWQGAGGEAAEAPALAGIGGRTAWGAGVAAVLALVGALGLARGLREGRV